MDIPLKVLIKNFLYEQKKYHDQMLFFNLHNTVLREAETALIEFILEMTGGNQFETAKMLGLNRTTLRKKIKLYKIDVKHYKEC